MDDDEAERERELRRQRALARAREDEGMGGGEEEEEGSDEVSHLKKAYFFVNLTCAFHCQENGPIFPPILVL